MHFEISALFPLQPSDEVVEEAEIGSGVLIQRLTPDWLGVIKTQCPNVAAREQVEPLPRYTHRLFYSVESEFSVSGETLPTVDEQQRILWAIVLLRIVKPTSMGYNSVWVKSVYDSLGAVSHYSDPEINNLTIAYTIHPEEDWNTITGDDAKTASELWDHLQLFIANEQKYQRILRALKYYEWSYAIPFAEIMHPIVHAALESMICAGEQKGTKIRYRQNRRQVTTRLPQLVSFVSKPQAQDIYLTCCDFKHAAAAMLKERPTTTGALTESDQRRVDSVILLRKAVRYLLIKALREIGFANILCDENLLKQNYPI